MSTSAILPISAISAPAPVDYNSAAATTAQQAVFNSVLNQLQQSVASGDLPSSQTLLNAVEAISPSASSGTAPLATFLSSLTTALGNNSISDAQVALSTYLQSASASGSSSSTPLIPTANAAAEAAQITAKVVKNASQLFVNTHPKPTIQVNPTNTSASHGSAANILKILNAAYPSTSLPAAPSPAEVSSSITPPGSSASSSSSNPSIAPHAVSATPSTNAASSSYSPATTSSSTPYDTLVASIQASLAAGNGTLTPALAYLQAAGNFVNTSA